jgi:processive 1,2-diacylglycerol beta-glucosyltransferase
LAKLPRSSSQTAVLTASFGDGHNSAAKGIASALEQSDIPTAGPVDLLKAAKPGTMHLLNAAYRTIITRWPWIWQRLYRVADNVPVGDVPVDFTRSVTRLMAEFFNATQPAAVISTYPLYGHLIEQLFGTQSLPFSLLTVVTDSTTINRAWLNNAKGHYAVTDKHSADFFLANAIPEDRVHITGFPVDPAFAHHPRRTPDPDKSNPLKILYTPSTGIPVVRKTLQSILEISRQDKLPLQLTVVLGRHEKRLRKIVESTVPESTIIIGWTDQMPALLSSHDLLIGKAGGASVHEALVAGCPMLIDYVVPGQEEGNAGLLLAHKAGLIVRDPGDIKSEIISLQENSSARLLAMRRAALQVAQPEAALKIAELAVKIATMEGHQMTGN